MTKRYRIKEDAIISVLSPRVKEKVYREKEFSYTVEDVMSHASDSMGLELEQEAAEVIAENYLDDGHDCSRPYWDCIEGCIEQYLYYQSLREERNRV